MSEPGARVHAADASLADPTAGVGAAAALALALLALVDLALLWDPVRTIPAVFSKNFNEGWNALHAVAVFGPRPLYPPPDSLLGNNYPPLSYYLLALLGPLFGDHIVAGRVVALVSLGVVTVNLGLLVRRLGATGPAAAATALLFLGSVASRFENYVAMNDPQWLAHALMTTGLLVLVGARERRGRAALAAVLLVVAGLVKHILVPIPAAAAVWLALRDRRQLAAFAGAGALALAIASVVLVAAHGRDMIVDIFLLKRTFQPEVLGLKLDDWLAPFAAPIALAALSCVRDRRDPQRRLLHLYLGGALAVLLAAARGVAVNYNAAFDFVIATFACAGLALDPLAEVLAPLCRVGPAAARGLAIASLSVMPLLGAAKWATGPDGAELAAREANEFAADLQVVRSTRGAAGCTTPALCYWAGRPTAIDVFKASQLHASGRLPAASLVARIQRQRWQLVQVDGLERLQPEVRALLEQQFRLARRSAVNGLLFVRRSRGAGAPGGAPRARP